VCLARNRISRTINQAQWEMVCVRRGRYQRTHPTRNGVGVALAYNQSAWEKFYPGRYGQSKLQKPSTLAATRWIIRVGNGEHIDFKFSLIIRAIIGS
jgi:hypothetical protein